MVRSCPHKLKESDGDGESEVDAATRCHGALTPDPNLIRGNKGLSPSDEKQCPFYGEVLFARTDYEEMYNSFADGFSYRTYSDGC